MPYSFPPISPFPELIQCHQRNPNKILIRDHASGLTATAGQLLHNVAVLRAVLLGILAQDGENHTKQVNEDRFIFLLAPPGLEYVTSMLTTFSIGAGMSAHSLVITPDEMIRFFKIAKPLALLYTSTSTEKVNAIKSLQSETEGENISRIPFLQVKVNDPIDSAPPEYTIDQDTSLPSDQIGTLFFTSGTSGSPKGVVHSYKAILASARERIDSWKLTEDDAVLCQKPGNWMGGIFGILPTLMSGGCLETCAGVFDAKWFWERIGQGGLSVFSIAPEGYDRFAEYFDEHLALLSPAEQEKYIQGIEAVKFCGATGSLLQPKTQERWTNLRRGKPLLNLYGSTEVTLICSMRFDSPEYADMCSVGALVMGIEAKIVEGELRLKAPTMFSRYISDDPTHTEKAFDSEGFFKTGDCAEKLEDCYVLRGRANIDVMHFWGFTLHTSEIENAISSLPYIDSAVVFPVEDAAGEKRAAAVIRVKPTFQSKRPALKTLRNDLTQTTGLMLFKQPTVVYRLQEGEDVVLTPSGKISKIKTRNKLFGEGWQDKENVEVLDLEAMEYFRMGGQC